MRSYCRTCRRVLTLTILFLILYAFSGCALVGPRSISTGRADYSEVINKTEDEQMLLSIVKGRYGETLSLLAVSSVAANVRFFTSAGIQAGFGPNDNYAGNIVPFSGVLAYEENPTITYTPVQGELYIRQLLSPVPLEILILLLRNETDYARPFAMLAKRVNDMRNPDFLDVSSATPDSRFQRFVELHSELDRAGVLQLLAGPGKEAPFNILITGYAPAYSEKVNEYLSLLGLPLPMDQSKDIVLPVHFAVKGGGLGGIAISTRSTFALVQVLQAAVEVPEEHATEGLTIKYPAPGLVGKNIRIRSSKDEPKRAAVAVKHRGYWFYIDDANLNTKMFYKVVRMLWSVSIASSSDQKAAPVLTIPVSR
jgi:hypothetical protein